MPAHVDNFRVGQDEMNKTSIDEVFRVFVHEEQLADFSFRPGLFEILCPQHMKTLGWHRCEKPRERSRATALRLGSHPVHDEVKIVQLSSALDFGMSDKNLLH